MATILTSPADFANEALGRIGYKRRIGSLYDGSPASAAVLDIYSQTRDDLLRGFDWGFAERNASLTLLKTAPASGYTVPWTSDYPPLPWIFEYGYTDDCLKVRSLRKTPPFIPEYDPKPVEFRIANDNSYSPAKKVILCNISNAICVYTAQVTDPATWEPSFNEAFIAALARRLAPALTTLQTEQAEAQDEAAETQVAEMRIG